jgi:hypothetical protein
MKLSSSTVFVIILGVFVAFCMFSHVKRRYTENMNNHLVNEKHPDTIEYDMVRENNNSMVDAPDYEERKHMKDPRKIKRTFMPSFMRPENMVSNVEGMTERNETSGSFDSRVPFKCVTSSGAISFSAYGCCADDTAKMDIAGSNCTSNKTIVSVTPVAGSVISAGSSSTSSSSSNSSSMSSTSASSSATVGLPNVSGTSMSASGYPTALPQTCQSSLYGCCPDGMTSRNTDGSNCTANTDALQQTQAPTPVYPDDMYAGVMPFNTNTVLIPPPVGIPMPPAPPPLPVNNCPDPPPCPACERCPDSNFECKKIPKYDKKDSEKFLPQAVLSDFSTFGM